MLVRVEGDNELLKDMFKISSTDDITKLSKEFGLQTSQILEVQNTFYTIAPPLRSRGSTYSSVIIKSNLIKSSVGQITLDQEHKKRSLDFTKANQRTEDVEMLN
jgi:hypothetical protein